MRDSRPSHPHRSFGANFVAASVCTGNNTHCLKLLIKTTSLVRLPRERASCLQGRTLNHKTTHRFASAVQFNITVIGAEVDSSSGVLMRNRCPSAVTA